MRAGGGTDHALGVAREDEGDTIYAIDRVAEHVLVEEIARTMATRGRAGACSSPKGCLAGEVVVPEGTPDGATSRWTIIVDPIDGTRGLMYQKRPAWILTGVAPDRGPSTLADIELAVQTEIPLDQAAPVGRALGGRGQGAAAPASIGSTGEQSRRSICGRRRATTIAHGFAHDLAVLPGRRAELAAIDDEVVDGGARPAAAAARRSRSRISTSRPAASSTS